MAALSIAINISCNQHHETVTSTLSDPGYFRQLTIRGGGGALKAPPHTISKTIVSIFTISYRCILPGVLGMFQLEFIFDHFTAISKLSCQEISNCNNFHLFTITGQNFNWKWCMSYIQADSKVIWIISKA